MRVGPVAGVVTVGVVMLGVLTLAGCSQRAAVITVRAKPVAQLPDPISVLLLIDDGLDQAAAAQVMAVMQREAKRRGGPQVTAGAAPSGAVVTLASMGVDPEPVTLRRERWADDGGPTRMISDRVTANRAAVTAHVRIVNDGQAAEMETYTATRYGVGGGDDTGVWRLSGEVVPVVAGSPAQVLDHAIADLANQLLDRWTGAASTVETIPLASDDPAQAELLRLAQDGELGRAESGLRALIAAGAGASAHYNLGAVIDAQGRHEEALQHYGTAIGMQPTEAWRAVIAACSQRAATATQLEPQPE